MPAKRRHIYQSAYVIEILPLKHDISSRQAISGAHFAMRCCHTSLRFVFPFSHDFHGATRPTTRHAPRKLGAGRTIASMLYNAMPSLPLTSARFLGRISISRPSSLVARSSFDFIASTRRFGRKPADAHFRAIARTLHAIDCSPTAFVSRRHIHRSLAERAIEPVSQRAHTIILTTRQYAWPPARMIKYFYDSGPATPPHDQHYAFAAVTAKPTRNMTANSFSCGQPVNDDTHTMGRRRAA